MKRVAFVGPMLAILATTPARASARKIDMSLESVLSSLHAQGAHAKTMVVRHVGAFVSTAVEIKPEKLAQMKPTAEVHDRATIDAALQAVVAADPSSASQTSEQRWHLAFLDASGTQRATVTSSISAPRHGTIDGHQVVFASDALVRFLARHFAPHELEAL